MCRRTLKKAVTFSAILSLFLLVGCGGGDDDDSSVTTFDASSSGTAAKGIIQNGTVTAEELDVNGNIIHQVGSATTDLTGN